MSRSVLAFPLVLLVVAGHGGCSASREADDDQGVPATLERTSSCKQTVCSAARESCEQSQSDCFDTCASGRIEDAALCFDICRGIECESCGARDTSPCLEPAYRFEVTGVPVPEIKAACERYEAGATSCLGASYELACNTLSRTAQPVLGQVFDCAAPNPCDRASACSENLPESDLGQAVCALIAERCPLEQCSGEDVEDFDGIGAWLRDDAAVAALDCAAEPCSSVWPCLDAWSSAIR